MSQTRQVKYKRYHQDQVVEETLILPDHHAVLQEADDAYLNFLSHTTGRPVNLSYEAITILGLLTGQDHRQEEYKKAKQRLKEQLAALSDAALALSNQAIAAQSGWMFGFGRDSEKYNALKSKLQQLGQYAKSKIIETPWYEPVDTNAYLLLALCDSPEAYLEANQDNPLKECIKALNKAKRLSTEVMNGQLTQAVQCYVSAVNEKVGMLNQLKIGVGHQIAKIEAKRQQRWTLTNFLVDLFSHEDRKLAALNNRKQAIISVESGYDELAKGQAAAQRLSMLKEFSQLLLSHPEQLTQEQLSLLSEMLKSKEAELVREDVINTIKKRLDHALTVEDALKDIHLLDVAGDAFWKSLDSHLYQCIQDKKQQYQQLTLLENEWHLLLDNTGEVVTDQQVDRLLAAMLWLDETSKVADQAIVSLFKSKITNNMTQLREAIYLDLEALNNRCLEQSERVRLRARLRFVTRHQAMYTKELSALRDDVVSVIVKSIDGLSSVQDFKAYLEGLRDLITDDFSDVVQKAILKKKQLFVRDSFNQEQKKLYDKFQLEIRFLQTGDLSLWEKVRTGLSGHSRTALTKENLSYWQSTFLNQFAGLLKGQVTRALEAAGLYGQKELNEQACINAFLDDLIAKDYQSLQNPLIYDLTRLVDLQRTAALQRLDQIFGLAPDQPVDRKLFMLRYLTLTSYQKRYADNHSMNAAGLAFVRAFQDKAQHHSGFVTGLIDGMNRESLESMFLSWNNNPAFIIGTNNAKSPALFSGDIVGQVDTDQTSYIQLPRYLFLNMVFELIIRDINDLINNKSVDVDMLKERMAFAIPKLRHMTIDEHEVNRSQILHDYLLQHFSNLSKAGLEADNLQLMAKHLPDDMVIKDSLGFVSNKAECESHFLAMIKAQLKDQADVLSSLDSSIFNVEKIGHRQDNEAAHISLIKQQWLQEFKAYLPVLNRLLDDREAGLGEFLKTLNEPLLDLLPENTRAVCLNMRYRFLLMDLLENDADFRALCQSIHHDLTNENIPLVDIIRRMPESITKQLPSQTADLIAQLQYRFADRFNGLMVKLLNDNYLNTMNEKQHDLEPARVQGHQSRFFGRQPQNRQQTRVALEKYISVEDRLLPVFKTLSKNAIDVLLSQLSKAAKDENDKHQNASISINALCKMLGVSQPMAIQADPNRFYQLNRGKYDGLMQVGNPEARRQHHY